jgi:N-acetylneuraminate synthase
MNKTKIIAEAGINFAYGEDKSKFLDNAKQLIDIAALSGCDYVKFQKRTPDLCVPDEQKSKPKRVPWNSEEITYLEYKYDSELGEEEYSELFEYAKSKGIKIFASVWDKPSVDFMYELHRKFDDEDIIMKIPSALITDLDLCAHARDMSKILIISTGMSTEEEIRKCVDYCDPDVIMHTNSSYPSHINELNLEYINWIRNEFTTEGDVGYSGHEYGLTTTMAAVAMGASWIERHITLDRTLWGSDQMASVEPIGLMKLVKGIRDIESAMGGFGPRKVIGSELEKRKSLRGN